MSDQLQDPAKPARKNKITLPFDPSKPLKSIKRERFARETLKNPNPTIAYEVVYQSGAAKKDKPTAHVNSSKLLSNTNVRSRIDYLLNQSKALSLPALTAKHEQLLSATKPLVIDNQVTLTPDYQVQQRALETGYKLHGVLQADHSQVIERQQVINILPEHVERMAALAQSMREATERLMHDRSGEVGAE